MVLIRCSIVSILSVTSMGSRGQTRRISGHEIGQETRFFRSTAAADQRELVSLVAVVVTIGGGIRRCAGLKQP